MILHFYQILCGYMAAMIVWALFSSREKQEKAVLAVMLIPFVLRFLLIK